MEAISPVVLYASGTGTAESIARRIHGDGVKLGYNVRIFAMNEFKKVPAPRRFIAHVDESSNGHTVTGRKECTLTQPVQNKMELEQLVIFVCSTTGDGETPDNGVMLRT